MSAEGEPHSWEGVAAAYRHALIAEVRDFASVLPHGHSVRERAESLAYWIAEDQVSLENAEYELADLQEEWMQRLEGGVR